MLGAGPPRSCSHLHAPGPRHPRDEPGSGAERRGPAGSRAGWRPPSRGCLDNTRNRGRGLFRRRGRGFLPQSLPPGAGRRKGLDVAEAGSAGAALTPPPSPRPGPWHPIHPARADPRPDIPSGSVPTRRPPLQRQVSVRIPAPAPRHRLAPGRWPSEGGGPRTLSAGCAWSPAPAGGGGVWGEAGWRPPDSTGSGSGSGCSKRCICTRVSMDSAGTVCMWSV